MNESLVLEDLEEELEELEVEADENEEELIYLFNQGLEALSSEYFESALICFCSVIEAVSARRREEDFIVFKDWIKKDGRLESFVDDLNTDNPESAIEDWFDRYWDTHGVRRNFSRTVIDAYRILDELPGFLRMKTEKVNDGVKRSSHRDIGDEFEDAEEAYQEAEKVVKNKIYDEYRNSLVHEGNPLNFVVSIKSKIGGASAPGNFSMQGVARVAFTVLKVEIRDNWD